MLLKFFVYLNNCNCEKCLKKSQNCDNYTIVKRRKRGKKRGERVRKGMEKYVDKYVENVEKWTCCAERKRHLCHIAAKMATNVSRNDMTHLK